MTTANEIRSRPSPEPALLRRLQALEVLTQGLTVPVAAHLRVEVEGRPRDLLLGGTAAPAARPPILQWETAPFADVFYETREGDEYELELGDRFLEGRVLQRHLLLVERGELAEVWTEAAHCVREEAGWLVLPRAPTLLPRPGDRKPRKVELDAAQRAIVELPQRDAVLVLGEAGAGKTTVAVHRIQRLLEANPKWSAGVIVPTAPLRHRIDSMLRRLGVDRFKVYDFDQWAALEARRAFRDLPTKDSRHAPAGVVRIKRDPSLRVAMEALVGRWSPKKKQVRRSDLGELFGDRKLLELAAAHADPLIPLPQIDEVLAHNRVQFSTEGDWIGGDGEELAGLDGLGLDEGTELADAGTLDPEDPPVLFALEKMRADRFGGRPSSPRRFDVLFVDEAQELAPFELELLGRSHRGALIVAGDAGQQVDPTACFRGWDFTVEDLGLQRPHRAELKIGYRCPPEISAFADAVAAGGKGQGTEAVRLVPHAHESHLVAWIVEEIAALRRNDPAITVGVVVRDAARMARLLDRGLSVVGAEELLPGSTHVVSVLAAKGLEFDTVILADADARSFPDTDESRRALYVATTRATHQLVLTWSGAHSPLISP